MDESSHTSTLALTRSFSVVVQGTGAISVALQLLTEPPVPGTWEETVAVSKKGTSLPALLVHAVVCASPGACLPSVPPGQWVPATQLSMARVCNCNAWPYTEERSLRLLTLCGASMHPSTAVTYKALRSLEF